MPGMMDGKVAVVTGAGGGIGREIALMMAAAGAKVIVADIGASLTGEGESTSPAQQTKQLIEQKGGQAEICTESVASWTSAQKIVQATLDHYGRIDAVVNNAGILRDADGLKPSSDGKRIAFDGPGRTVIDGPFAAPRELVAGFWLWEVKDMDEAIAWVKRCPNPMPVPSEIEIRPLYEMSDLV